MALVGLRQDPFDGREIWSDPVRRRWIIPSRFAFRNKHAAMDPRELARKKLALIEAKARL